MNSFYLPTEILYGAGCLADIAEKVAVLGKKAMIISDPYFNTNGLAKKLQSILSQAALETVIYDGVIPNPTTDSIDKGARIARDQKCNVVIGLGGGSAMDTAKGIAVAATHPGLIWDYAIGAKTITNSVLPIVAISTTSGTGSQCTCYAVITNPQTKQKPGMGSPYILPKLAVVDPELMLTAPAKLTFETGFDVFSHAVEAYTSKIATPMSDMYAEKAIQLVTQYLPLCYRDGSNLQARYHMALADTYAGIAICHGCVSIGHVIAHIIGGNLPEIAHGEALFSIYRGVLKLNAQVLPQKHQFVADCLDKGNKDICIAFDNFFGPFKYNTRIPSALKIEPLWIKKFAEETFTYMKGITELNPIEASVKDVEKILMDCI